MPRNPRSRFDARVRLWMRDVGSIVDHQMRLGEDEKIRREASGHRPGRVVTTPRCVLPPCLKEGTRPGHCGRRTAIQLWLQGWVNCLTGANNLDRNNFEFLLLHYL